MVKELQDALHAEGTGSLFSLSHLRRLVALSSNDLALCSGQQQDTMEFLEFLLHGLPSEFIKVFEFTEKIVRKFVINGEHVPCPRCNTLPSSILDTRYVLQLPVPDIKDIILLADLIRQHFSPNILESGKQCDGPKCCPHGPAYCPGIDIKCKSLPCSEQSSMIQQPNFLLIQLKRFKQTMSGQFIKLNTQILASESISVNNTISTI